MPVAGEPKGLDVLQVEVERPGRHPLAVLTHGTSSDEAARAAITPWMFLPQATWFARRGYVVLVVIRRGYGRSGGEMDVAGGCRPGGTPVLQISERGAADLRSAAKFAETIPEVDTTQIVSVGVSTGGLDQIALASDPPHGLKASINFAGGYGADGKGGICDLNEMVSAYETLGKKVKIPTLWIYAENDHYYPPSMAKLFDAAFRKGGGTPEFVVAPEYHDEGHGLYNSPSVWTPTAESFLSKLGLLPLKEMLPDPAILQVPAPAGLGAAGQMAFHSFLTAGSYKAFAVTEGSSGWGMSVAQADQETADRKATETCQRSKQAQEGKTCIVVSRTQ